MIFISVTVLVYWFFRTCQQLIGLFQTKKFIFREQKQNLDLDLSFNKVELNILIPIFQEEKIILDTFNYFEKILNELNLKNYVKLIFVSTDREAIFQKNRTVKKLQEILKTPHQNIEIINYPNKDGNKAKQLNFAIKKLNSESEKNNKYFAIFDADSKPQIQAFRYFFNALTKNHDLIFQMPTLFVQNIDEVSYSNKANAIFQTRRVLAFEIPTWLNKKNLNYLVGHGLFLNSKIFEKYNIYFNEKTITEDLIFGYETNLRNIYPRIIPFFDIATVPKSIFLNIKQTARWFSGDLFFLKNINHNFNLKIFFRYFHIFEWIFGSILIIIISVFALFTKNLLLILLILLILFLYLIILHIFALKFIQFFYENKKINFIKMIYGLIVKSSTNSFGPVYGIFREFLSILKIKKYFFEKTER